MIHWTFALAAFMVGCFFGIVLALVIASGGGE